METKEYKLGLSRKQELKSPNAPRAFHDSFGQYYHPLPNDGDVVAFNNNVLTTSIYNMVDTEVVCISKATLEGLNKNHYKSVELRITGLGDNIKKVKKEIKSKGFTLEELN
jgi:hypothetical protein